MRKAELFRMIEEDFFDFHIRSCSLTGGIAQKECNKRKKDLLTKIKRVMSNE